MATITVEEQDLANADAFLTAYLSERITDADFSEGGVVRDFVVTAIAHIFAFLEKERRKAKDSQSLLALSTQEDSEEVSDAVNALLSNWFIDRKDGRTARLTARLHFSAAADITLTPTTRFFRTNTLVFVPDIPAASVIPASQLIPTYNSSNVVTDYTTTINLVAADVGTVYNVPAGKFVQADLFSPYFTYAENESAVNDGRDVETTSEILARAPTAITIRNLVNARSIDAVLRDEFTSLTRVLSVGYGEPEMLRDFTSEAVTRLRMHVGGHTDIYVQLPIAEVVETGVLGSMFTRPDNIISVLKDTTQDFTTAGVQAGHVLHVATGLRDAPREFIVSAVGTDTLTITTRTPFTEATEELGTFVSYSVGTLGPSYSDIVSPQTTGQTSRGMQTAGRVMLSGRPHYKIKKVELYETSAPSVVEVLTARVNGAPGIGEYRIEGLVPANAQSAYAVDQLEINGHGTGTWLVRTTYDTLVDYNSVQAFVTDRFARVLASSPLVKGYTPVYMTLSVQYRLKSGQVTELDEEAAASTLAAYVNAFDLTNTLDVTGMLTHLREQYPEIGVIISPTLLTYELYAPNGEVFKYRTGDVVSVYPAYPENNAQLVNGAELRTPIYDADLPPSAATEALILAANQKVMEQLTAQGVSDRTLVYVLSADDVTFTKVL